VDAVVAAKHAACGVRERFLLVVFAKKLECSFWSNTGKYPRGESLTCTKRSVCVVGGWLWVYRWGGRVFCAGENKNEGGASTREENSRCEELGLNLH
jgi:hypothetical protein